MNVRGAVAQLFGADRFPQERYDWPPGDPGLFGPDSVTWRVHADASMFVGGIAALLLQSLHPRAAAVVASSSRFRTEPLHRLGRTASFVAASTYAGTPVATEVIDAVRATHARIPGASDPELLRWVHVAEVTSFLAAYRRFNLRPVDADRYYDETAVVGELLGAAPLPRSRDEVRAYYEGIRPELSASEASRELVSFLQRPFGPDPAVRATYILFVQAAMGQLPGWARGLHGMHTLPGTDRLVVRPATCAVLNALRVALGPSPLLRTSRQRASQPLHAETSRR